MKIINKPTATFKQCEAWIKSKKTANKLALENLQIMWDCAIANGIDPAVLIAQSMKETGWYNFGGVVPTSFHNPCGLKITKGGGDYEVGAHMRFKSWKEGIMAQSDHLALYAGAPNMPKYSPECASHQNANCKANGTTQDPRHFTYLFGKCPTVESLGCNWAPSASYGTDIVKMVNEIYSMKVVEEPVKQETIKKEEPVQKPSTVPVQKPVTAKPIVNNNKDAMKRNVEKSVNNFKKSVKNLKKKFKR